ncbi:MAG: hypothetical protein EZS28_019583, partial [Streblomastix strix]
IVGSIFNGCQCSDLAYILDIPTVPVPVSLFGTQLVMMILGCSRKSNSSDIEGQWVIFTPPSNSIRNPQGFAIDMASQAVDNIRGFQFGADGNTLMFNERVTMI